MAITTGDLVYLTKFGLHKSEEAMSDLYPGQIFYNNQTAYNQLTAAQTQAVQQYANQYNPNMLGQLGQGAALGNVLSGQSSFGSYWNDYVEEYQNYVKLHQTEKDKSLMPAPKVNKKAENEAWLDSKIAEVSFVL